jgi:hypothetical protein
MRDMIYTLTLERSDGYKQVMKFDSRLLESSTMDLIPYHAKDMYYGMKDIPEVTEEELAARRRKTFEEDMEAKAMFYDEWLRSLQPGRRSKLQYGEQILPSNPHEPSPFMKRLQDMAKMTPYEREAHQKMERLQREGFVLKDDHIQDALLYGTTFPQQTLNTFVKDDSNDQSES